VSPITLSLTISMPGGSEVSGLLKAPNDALTCYVFAHGAAARIESFFYGSDDRWPERRVATLRVQLRSWSKAASGLICARWPILLFGQRSEDAEDLYFCWRQRPKTIHR
jgi:hypothetical protein